MTLKPPPSIQNGRANEVFVRPGSGEYFEAAISAIDDWSDRQSNVEPVTTLLTELAPLATIRTWLLYCPGAFAKDMVYGLMEASVLSYDRRDWETLAEAIISWGATLQIEADRPLAKRLRRQLQKSHHDNLA